MKYLFSLIFVLIVSHLNAQDVALMTIKDDALFGVSKNDATLTLHSPINYYQELEFAGLTYSPDDNVFYTKKRGFYPQLYTIDSNGTIELVGDISYENETVVHCEGIALNRSNNKLYGAINIGTVNQYQTNYLAEIDKQTGICTIVSQLTGTNGSPDMDVMVFGDNNMLYFVDGLPSSYANASNFYSYDTGNISDTFTPELIFSTDYYPFRDLAFSDGNLYIPSNYPEYGGAKELYKLSLNSLEFELVGDIEESQNTLGFEGLTAYNIPNPVIGVISDLPTTISITDAFVFDNIRFVPVKGIREIRSLNIFDFYGNKIIETEEQHLNCIETSILQNLRRGIYIYNLKVINMEGEVDFYRGKFIK